LKGSEKKSTSKYHVFPVKYKPVLLSCVKQYNLIIMARLLVVIFLFFGAFSYTQAQSVFGLKGGMLMGSQKWNQSKRDPLISYSGYMFWDLKSNTNSNMMFQMGYRRPGSAIRVRNVYANVGGNVVDIGNYTREMAFHNVSFMFGGKSRYELGRNMGYYLIGGRVDITVAHKNDIFGSFEDNINLFTYGINAGLGIEIPVKRSDFIIELQLAPDLGPQIYVPPGIYYNRYTGQNQMMQEQRVFNFAAELMVGWRFKARA